MLRAEETGPEEGDSMAITPPDFSFGEATVTADGLLVLTGSVITREAADATDSYSFILARRGGGPEHEYPARPVSEAGDPRPVRCSIPLFELGFGRDDVVDVYFQASTGTGETRTRVVWQRQSLRWLPYPTKYGNLSLKRKTT
jgi:hypothetical protein